MSVYHFSHVTTVGAWYFPFAWGREKTGLAGEEGRKKMSSKAIYAFSMEHTEEKMESHVTDPAGKCGARWGRRGVSHQLPTFRSSVFQTSQPSKRSS